MNSRKSPRIQEPTATAGLNTCGSYSQQDYEKDRASERANTMAQVGASVNVLGPVLAVQIDQLQGLIYAAMQANGFWNHDQDNFGQKTALVHSEVSEMLEANRKSVEADDKIPEFTGEEAEAADVIIRLLDMAGRYNWRLGEAITAKLLYNLSRPYKHGKGY